MIARRLRWLRAHVAHVLEARVSPAQDTPAPPPSSAFARDVLCTLVNAGLSADEAARTLRSYEVTGGWSGPYAVYGLRQVEFTPGVNVYRHVRLLQRDWRSVPADVPVLLATLYAAETETCDLPEDLDRAWKEVIRVAAVAARRCVEDAWVEREVEPGTDEPTP